jgi:hypothetical protein
MSTKYKSKNGCMSQITWNMFDQIRDTKITNENIFEFVHDIVGVEFIECFKGRQVVYTQSNAYSMGHLSVSSILWEIPGTPTKASLFATDTRGETGTFETLGVRTYGGRMKFYKQIKSNDIFELLQSLVRKYCVDQNLTDKI